MTTIDLAQAGEHFDKLGKEMREAAKRGLVSAAERALQVILTQIIPSRSPEPRDMGTYRAGWHVDPHEPEDGATIYNDEPHAIFIEEGVQASNVKIGEEMLQMLSEWAIRKGLAADEEEALDVAWAVARAAQRRGIFGDGEGLGIMRELVEQHLDRIIEQEVEREMRRVGK
jgi:hypothetical protein